MRLIISEKNIAARRIAEILAVGKPTSDKVYSTPVYRFRRDGEDWVSIGLKGHIMKVDFPEEYSKWRASDLSALVDAPILKVPTEKGIIQSLRTLAGKSDAIVIATDFDREGELIGSDARGVVLDVNEGLPVSRARFSAITKGEIERAFSELGVVSDDLAQAGEARQDIDLVWGAVLTRYLTIASNQAAKRAWGSILSAGRVQTPTLKLIVDRERERDAFVPETYWTVRATFAHAGEEFAAGHATDRFKSEAEAAAVMAAVGGANTGRVAEVTKTKRSVPPPAPFNTTSLMAAASAEGLSPANTMRIAESLYMEGLISYPRVDNTVYPSSLELRSLVQTLSAGPAYHAVADSLLRKSTLTATRGSKEATDHPPIHPTGLGDPDRLKADEWKLYNLVARRFMATLSDAAVVESTKVRLDVNDEPFVAKGDVIVSAGFRAIYPYGLKKEEHLPALAEGQEAEFLGATMEEKQTQPPARFSQGKLIQEMEKLGLGTKATRHTILQNLYDRKYVTGDPIEPTCQGETVIKALMHYADRITTPEMTRELEHEMEAIAEANAKREDVVSHSRQLLAEVMRVLTEHAVEVGETLKVAADEDSKLGTCPKSGHDLRVKYSPKTKSNFVGCTGYPECGVTYPLPKGRYESVDERCPSCGTPQVKLIQFKQRPRTMCLDPECETRREPEVDVGPCPTGDEGRLIVRRSPSTLKRYCRCTNYENCQVSYPLPQSGDIEQTGEVCECGSPKIVVHTRKGPWKICVNPECPTKASNGSPGGASRGRARSAKAPKPAGRGRAPKRA